MAKSYYHDGTEWQALIRGEKGGPGPKGDKGDKGDKGEQGPPGGVQVGGRNLILNSATFNTINSNNSVSSPITMGTDEIGDWITGEFTALGQFLISTYTTPTYKDGAGTQFSGDIMPLPDVFTQSIELMSSVPMTAGIYTGDPVALEPGVWTRVSRTYTPSDFDFMRDRMMGPAVGITPDIPLGTKLYHRNWKLERGNRATDWTPAPEDLGVNPDTAQWAAPHSLALELADRANVQVGGRNLLLNSDFSHPTSVNGFNVSYGTHEIVDGRYVKTFTSAGGSVRIEKNFDLNEIGQFTYSICARLPSSMNDLDWRNAVGLNHNTKIESVVGAEFAVYSVTFTNEEPGQKTLRAYTRPTQVGDVIEIEWEKLERGNRATDWTPAPEDIGVNPDTVQWAAPHSLALELAAAITIVGAGRPDILATLDPDVVTRVQHAPSGTVFRSTDGAQGAWEWRKRGATWVCEVGDTGWRNITSLLLNGWVAPGSGAVHIRRHAGTVVEVMARTISGSDATSTTFATLPAGFRSGANGRTLAVGTSTTSFITWDGNMQLTLADSASMNAVASTTDPWPTTLPGTSA